MLMYSANDQFFVHLRELSSDPYLPIRAYLGAQIRECAANSVWGFEKHRQAGL